MLGICLDLVVQSLLNAMPTTPEQLHLNTGDSASDLETATYGLQMSEQGKDSQLRFHT